MLCLRSLSVALWSLPVARQVYLTVQQEQVKAQALEDASEEEEQLDCATGTHGRASKRAHASLDGSCFGQQQQEDVLGGGRNQRSGFWAQRQKSAKQAARPLVFKWRQPPNGVSKAGDQRLEQQQGKEEKGSVGSFQQLQQQEQRQDQQQLQPWQGAPSQQKSVQEEQLLGGFSLSGGGFSGASSVPSSAKHPWHVEQHQVQLVPDWELVARSCSEPDLMYRPGSGSLPLVQEGSTTVAAAPAVMGVGYLLASHPSNQCSMQSCGTAEGLMRFSSVDSGLNSGRLPGAAQNLDAGLAGLQRKSPIVLGIDALRPCNVEQPAPVSHQSCIPAVVVMDYMGEQQGFPLTSQQQQKQQASWTPEAYCCTEQHQQQVPQAMSIGTVDPLIQDDLMQQLLTEHGKDHHLWVQQQQQMQGPAEVGEEGLSGEFQGHIQQQLHEEAGFLGVPCCGMGLGDEGPKQQGNGHLPLPSTLFREAANDEEHLDVWLTGMLSDQAVPSHP